MLRSVAFSSSSMNTPRFTPPTTKVEAKSPPVAQAQRSGFNLFERLRILPKEQRILSMYWGSYRILRKEFKRIQEQHGSTPIELLSAEERMRYLYFARSLGEVKNRILSEIHAIPRRSWTKSINTIVETLDLVSYQS